MFYIDIIDNSLFCNSFISPFEIDIAFEGGFKYLRFKHKINRWMDDLQWRNHICRYSSGNSPYIDDLVLFVGRHGIFDL